MADQGLSRASQPATGPGWQEDELPPAPPPGLRGWLRVMRRGLPAMLVLALGVPVLMLLRLI